MKSFFANAPTNRVVKSVAVQVPARRAAAPPSRQVLSPARNEPTPQSRRDTHRRLSKAAAKGSVKRKEPPRTQQFSDDEADTGAEDSDWSFDPARKRVRSSASSVEPSRKIGDTANRSRRDGGLFDLAHAADLVSGDSALHFMPFFVEEEATKIELQYPSRSQRERFYLAKSLESDGYNALDDIRETVKFVCMSYLSQEQAAVCLDPDSGLERRLRRAAHGQNPSCADFVAAVDDYNKAIAQALDAGTIVRELSMKHTLQLDLVQRILDQIYSRTVSPHVDILKEYKNGTDNVYGELLPPLISEIFKETELRSDQVFVDLGSGVGNVVLQAALEVGCESWGCEMMKNPCELAKLQAEEFPARARLWGLAVGEVHLLDGDFLENRAIGEVLKRADVVLVNNQAFGPELNSKLVDRFLDLKDGCRIVSLKSFKPEGYEIQERNMGDARHLLRVVKKPFWSASVSWTDAPGSYHIATKDPTDIQEFMKGMEKQKRARR